MNYTFIIIFYVITLIIYQTINVYLISNIYNSKDISNLDIAIIVFACLSNFLLIANHVSLYFVKNFRFIVRVYNIISWINFTCMFVLYFISSYFLNGLLIFNMVYFGVYIVFNTILLSRLNHENLQDPTNPMVYSDISSQGNSVNDNSQINYNAPVVEEIVVYQNVGINNHTTRDQQRLRELNFLRDNLI